MRNKIGIIIVIAFMGFISIGKAERYSKKLCSMPDYICYKVNKGETWENLFVDKKMREITMRINRMNEPLYPGITIAIPNNLEKVDYIELAPFDKHIDTSGRKVIIIDINEQAYAAYDIDGVLIRWGPVSTALGYCPDVKRSCRTPRGKFFVYAAGNEYCKSTIFPIPKGGAPMPYCMYFCGGFALHGGELPGYNASHGCVRMFVEDAKWLNRNFVNIGRNGTVVIVR